MRVHARRALIVDRDDNARELLARILSRYGFDVVQAADSDEVYLLLQRHRPDLTIVDVVVDEASGIQLVRMLKEDGRTSTIPVIILTARSDEAGRIRGFEAGADDCIVKTSVSVDELLARIRALLRRAYRNEPNGLIRACGLIVDVVSQRVTFRDRIVEIGPLGFRLLSYLMAHPDKILSRTMILTHVWDKQLPQDARAVDAQVSQLRHMLKAYHCDRCIQTVYGMGYRFSAYAMH